MFNGLISQIRIHQTEKKEVKNNIKKLQVKFFKKIKFVMEVYDVKEMCYFITGT